MIKANLRDFIDQVTAANAMTEADVQRLQADILEEGLQSRLEAEALMALDRMVETPEGWGAVLTKLVVDFVVWRQLPHGVVGNDDALWLATVLDMSGPSAHAMAIAYAILDEAGYVDVALLDFIMRARQQARLSRLAA